MQCYTLNQRTLLLLIALVAMLLVLSFSGGYYSGLRNAPKPPPPRALKEELLTAFLEAPAREERGQLEVIAEIDPPGEPATPPSPIPAPIPAAEPQTERPEATPIRLTPPPPTTDVAAAPPETASSKPPSVSPDIEQPTIEEGAAPRSNEPMSAEEASPPPREIDTSPAPTTEPTVAEPRPAKPTPASSPAEPPIVGYAVQVGSFSEPRYAEASAKRWRRGGHSAFVYRTTNASGRRWHTVRIGFFQRRDEAAAMAERLREEEGRQAVTVPLLVMPEER